MIDEQKNSEKLIKELQAKREEVLKDCDAKIRLILKKYNANFIIDPNSPISNPKIVLILNQQ